MKRFLLPLVALIVFGTGPHSYGQECNQTLWRHVYHGTFPNAQARLKPLKACGTVTGTIVSASPEADGDIHIRLNLDPQFTHLLNSANYTGQKGFLVVEPMCAKVPTQADTISEGVCNGFTQHLFIASMRGKHVAVTGSYVQDMEHGWREIHPVTSITIIP